MPITRRFTVYTNAGVSVPPVIHVNQYDRGETWIFTLLEPNGSQYIPASGGIVGIKADGHAIINTATVNGNGEVVVSETQQMTAAAGKAVYEIIFDNSTHGTANFIVCVEPKPGDNATLSDSDLSLIQEAIESTIPANIEASVQDWMDDNLAPAEWVIDNTLSIAGAAADAKKTGDGLNELKTNLNLIDTSLDPYYDDIEDIQHTVNTGWYIGETGKVFVIGNQNFKVSTVPVERGKTYRIHGTTRLNATYPVVCYGTTATLSDGLQGSIILTNTGVNTTYNDYYTADNDGYLWVASYQDREILTVTECGKKYKNVPIRQTVKMQLFGDSITDNTWGDLKTWANYISEFMPFYDLTIVNSAVGGSRLSKSSSTTDAVENLIEDGTTVQTDSNIIVIWAGTNDWASSAPLLGEFLGNSGIYGAVKNIIQTLSTNAPNALILFATPLQRYNAADQSRETDAYGTPINNRGYTLKQFCDAIIETCEYYGIPCIDMNGMSGINRINVNTFTDDGLHPNTKGDIRIAHEICNKIDSLIGYSQ